MRRESIFDMDVDVLPPKFTGASYLRYVIATEGTTDVSGIGTLTTVDTIQAVSFPCKWQPFITGGGLIIVYYEFPNQESFLVQAIEDFINRITVI